MIKGSLPFNRTTLELKPGTLSIVGGKLKAFNRTTLELKPNNDSST